jgi:hypothetical protein
MAGTEMVYKSSFHTSFAGSDPEADFRVNIGLIVEVDKKSICAS